MFKIQKYENPSLYIFAVDEDPHIVDFLEELQELTMAAGHESKVFINCPEVRPNKINYCMKLETNKMSKKNWHNHNDIQLCVLIKQYKNLTPGIVMKKIAALKNYTSDNMEFVNKLQKDHEEIPAQKQE